MNKLQNCRNLFKQLHRNQSIWAEPQGYDTGISIFNCTARKKVPLILRRKNVATWYACGPTVYDTAHIGHASCYVKQDIVQRILRDYFHINLVTAMNVTNIDDKIIKRSVELNEDWIQLAKRYEMEFWRDLSRLGVREPNLKCRVSDYIEQIIQFIEKLIKNKSAYVTDDGSVYFELSRYKKYGKLQNLNLEQETNHEVKRSALDFALWKASKSSSEPSWLASWHVQPGRPGWHIECSAMASHLFGREIDIHSGGLDLRFPHHENEEAQSCAHHDCEQWVNYWLHTGQLHVEGDALKMSKSLKNTISISEMLEKYSAEQFRMLCLLTNYNNQMEYGKDSMDLATSLWKKLQMFQLESKAYVQGLKPLTNFCSESLYNEVGHTARFIDMALRDNFNTARCIDLIMNLITFTNKLMNSGSSMVISAGPDLGAIQGVHNFVQHHMELFGLAKTQSKNYADDINNDERFENIVESLIYIRNYIRKDAVKTKNKDLFKLCDRIRDELKRNSIQVKDYSDQKSSWSIESK